MRDQPPPAARPEDGYGTDHQPGTHAAPQEHPALVESLRIERAHARATNTADRSKPQ